jgi:LacI family transcriptional regulator
MAATLKQIAQKTGFSLPTVHQILNGYDVPFAEATRKKVLAAAAEMNYKPNITARSLVKGRSMLMGVLFNGVNHGLVSDLMRGVQSVVTARQYVPVLLTHGDTVEESVNIRTVLDRAVDGLLVNLAVDPDSTSNAAEIEKVHASGKPMVEIFGRFAAGVPNVTLDHEVAAAMATRRLVAQGHRSIALLVRNIPAEEHGKPVHWAPRDFTHGYESAISDAGLASTIVRYFVTTDLTRPYASFRGAYDVAHGLMAHPSKPTAVVCYRSDAADALMTYCDRHASEVPENFTIVTFSSPRPMVPSNYKVECWTMAAEQVGRLASQMVFDQIDGKTTSSVQLPPIFNG